jgi:antitoxin (DNA-binding transcriptional repressor) of toxin-antitoxin stability system
MDQSIISVSVEDAPERWDELLLRVERGDKVGIVRDGAVVAVLVPAAVDPAKPDVREAVEEMKRFRDEHGALLGPGENVRDLIDEGRRF